MDTPFHHYTQGTHFFSRARKPRKCRSLQTIKICIKHIKILSQLNCVNVSLPTYFIQCVCVRAFVCVRVTSKFQRELTKHSNMKDVGEVLSFVFPFVVVSSGYTKQVVFVCFWTLRRTKTGRVIQRRGYSGKCQMTVV